MDSERPSSTAASALHNKDGVIAINECLRSILMHPIGLLLASFLNEVSLSQTLYECCAILRGMEELWRYDIRTVPNDILSSAIKEWDTAGVSDQTIEQNEVYLTSIIFTKIMNQITDRSEEHTSELQSPC